MTAMFIWSHDQLALDLMAQSFLSVLGDIFVYRVLVLHKQHVIPFILTIRKMLTSIFNILYFHHSVVGAQYFGIGLVGVGIAIQLGL